MTYEIEKGIPIPSSSRFPLDRMEVEDSFAIPERHMEALRSAIRKFCAQNPGRKFTTRREDRDTRRCWRVS
jgi:hypothetical protein